MTENKSPFSIFSLKGSFVFVAILFLLGVVIQLIYGQVPVEALKFPINLYLFIELFFITIALWVLFKKMKFVQWLASSRAALSSISFFAMVVLIMAIIPQSDSSSKIIHSLGFNKVIYSWIYAFAITFLLLSLGLVTIRRMLPFRGRNIAFFINHFGLWLAMSTSILGFADKQEMFMPVNVNQLVWYAENDQKVITELPFALKLEKFTVKYHPPKIALMNKQGEPFKIQGDQLKEVQGKTVLQISKYKIEILDFYEHAFFNGDTIVNSPGIMGTTVAAKIKLNINQDSVIQTWINPSSFMFQGNYLVIHPDTILGLLSPEPSYYGSDVLLYTKSGIDGEQRTIAVNKPISAEGWKIYQYSYDGRLGKDSPYSVFLVIRDPWLPFVYIGIYLMMAGAIWLLFSRNVKKTNKISPL